jgi:hypothetical protein
MRRAPVQPIEPPTANANTVALAPGFQPGPTLPLAFTCARSAREARTHGRRTPRFRRRYSYRCHDMVGWLAAQTRTSKQTRRDSYRLRRVL